MREELPPAGSSLTIKETTVSEINIAGMPAVAMPSGYYASGAPFGLLFVGQLWSEADLLAYAYSYESATRHRKTPALTAR
jgi:Asp-tRNA(Asn)/Glu-tRNA(Gln) amidotransferase A subunit family amidase